MTNTNDNPVSPSSVAEGTFGVGACFGYIRVRDPKTQQLIWKIDEAEKAIIREAFELFSSGVNASGIADIFNRDR
jgi:hypothetical protein